MTLPTEGIMNKISVGVGIALIMSFLAWGTWVTVVTFDVEDVIVCAAENKQKIESKAGSLQRQINTRMDKQERKLDKQDEKLDKMMMILIDINKKEK